MKGIMFFKKTTLGMMLCLLFSNSFSQTCNTSSITATTPDSRFTPQGDGTVLDTQTNLIWKRCSEGQTWDGTSCTGSGSTYTWQGALEAAQTLNSGGGFASQTDWRVPNIKELASIVELQCYSPTINLTIFPNTGNMDFWSSSPAASIISSAWFVEFNSGYEGTNNKYVDNQVRLVRSGQ